MSEVVNKVPEKDIKKEEKPEFTLKNVLLDIYNGSIALVINPQCTIITYPIIICIASILTKIVINKIPYTEIDFKTYMQQIELINKGKLKYDEIYGDSGPIVYPGGFVQIYQIIKSLTDGNIKEVQLIFSYLFTISIAFTCVIYSNIINLQPWVIYLFILSKRLISIYVLRLFNDCWTTCSILGMIILLQQASSFNKSNKLITFMLCLLSADLYSISISIKMNALLYLPGFIIIVYFLLDENLIKFLITLLIIPLIQLIMGWNFLLPLYYNDEIALIIRWNYINQAFNFKRKFLYEWTVNWKFIPESIFLSNEFSSILLVLHISILLIFIFTRFLNSKIIGKSLIQLFKDIFSFKSTGSSNNNLLNDTIIGPQLIFIILSITNLIGVLFSRSLHYQFLSWYLWSIPGLSFFNFPIFISIPLWILHEWCWNVFPSTPLSSSVLIAILSLIVASTWWNFNNWFPKTQPVVEPTKKDE